MYDIKNKSNNSNNLNVNKPVPFIGKGFQPKTRSWMGYFVFFIIIFVVELGTSTGVISSLTLTKPSDVFETIIQLYQSGLLFKHLVPSILRLVIGALIGISLGISIGTLIGLFSYFRSGLVPVIAAIFPIPKIALLPLFIIWFGIGEGSKVATILFGTFFPTVIATYGGVDNVDRNLIRMGQSFGLTWLSIVRKIIIPGALPAILSG